MKRQLLSWLSIFVGILLWQVSGDYLVNNSLFLATPVQTARAIARLWQTGTLQHHMAVSGTEFIVGFTLASILGILLGLCMASFNSVADILTPWISGLYATPIVALAPLVILWLGIGIWSKIMVVVSLVLFPVVINTEVGLRATDSQLVEAIRAFGATSSQIFWKVSLPSALPFILAGLRLGVGRGLIGVVVGELFGSRAGLGFMIRNASEVFNMPELFSGVILLALAGILLNAAFQRLERRVLHWKED